MARARACRRRHLRRHVRLHPSGGRIEDKLRDGRAAFERHVTRTGCPDRRGSDAPSTPRPNSLVSTAGPSRPSAPIGIDAIVPCFSEGGSMRRAVVRDQQPAARPVSREMRRRAAHCGHIVYWRQRTGCLVDRKRPHPSRVGFVGGKQKFRRRIECQERRVLSDVRRACRPGRACPLAVSSRKIVISGR